jgi:hypothetical protein
MSDDFEAHPTNIYAAEAAETTLRIFLNPQAADRSSNNAGGLSRMVRRISIQN